MMHCRVCDSRALEPVIDLGLQPWCHHFVPPEQAGQEPLYPLRLVHCQQCRTAQLDYTVRKEVLFGNHTPPAGTSAALNAHFLALAAEVHARFLDGRRPKTVLDIGSNDGSLLSHYRTLGCDVLGVESSVSTAALANERGISTLNAFFDLEVAFNLAQRFDVVNASAVLLHVEELHSVTEGIRECLKPGGVLVVRFLPMRTVVQALAFDQIHHEHLVYFTLTTLQQLLSRHGLALFDAWTSPVHGGTIVGLAGRDREREPSSRLNALVEAEAMAHCNDLQTYRQFARDVATLRTRDVGYLESARARGRRVFGLGAPVKGNTRLNYYGAGPALIEYLVETNPLRKGLVSPGMHIPVVLESELHERPDVYYVLSWNLRQELLQTHRDLLEAGVEFRFPDHGHQLGAVA